MYRNCFINLKNMLKILRKLQKERPSGVYTTVDQGETKKGVDKEMIGSLLLDTGGLSNVAGLQWWNTHQTLKLFLFSALQILLALFSKFKTDQDTRTIFVVVEILKSFLTFVMK